MANQKQDFLRKINKGWSPVHMNLIKHKAALVKPKEKPKQDTITSDEKPKNE